MAKFLAQAGFQIDLICPWKVQKGLRDGIYFRPFPKAENRSSRYKNYKKIWADLTVQNYDIYHFHDLDLVPLFTLFKLLRGKNIVYDMHENYPQEMWHKSYIPIALKPLASLAVRVIEWVGMNIIHNLVVVEDNQERMYSTRTVLVLKIRNFATKEFSNGRIEN